MEPLILTLLVLATGSYALYRWAHVPAAHDELEPLPPPASHLFEGREGSCTMTQTPLQAESLLDRAGAGDKEALAEAQATGDDRLYDQVLSRLADHAATCQEEMTSLVSFIVNNDKFRVNVNLARQMVESWKAEPTRKATADMFHIAALTSDPVFYQEAVDTAVEFWREGRLSNLSASELRELMESQYWLIASSARASGPGFVLKQRLSRVRQELAGIE